MEFEVTLLAVSQDRWTGIIIVHNKICVMKNAAFQSQDCWAKKTNGRQEAK